jgi:CO/xanthine dehydrogenase Mo-binding subunit
MNCGVLKIGRSFPRADAEAKVRGVEKYAADYYGPDLLWAGVKRASIPHGLIRNIDIAAAARVPGVVRILTGADVPGANRHGIVHQDMPVLADLKVKRAGDGVALVIAETKESLIRALECIGLDIEPLAGVFDPEDALAPGAPLVHEGREQGNLLSRAVVQSGDGAAGLDRCPVVVEGSFQVPMQAHVFLETENGIAWRTDDGEIVMVVSTQAPYRDRIEIQHALGISLDRIRIIAPYLGGGFGGKDGVTVQCLLALAALHSGGRPVKMHWDREESFLAGYKRHAAKMYYALGADSDGGFRALRCKLYYDTGPYAHLGSEIMAMGLEHAAGPYRIPSTFREGFCVYTNNPVAGAMRAFGVVQPAFGIERMVDLLAEKLSMDPLSLRLMNALKPGDTYGTGVPVLPSTGIVQCLDTVEAHPLWKARAEWVGECPPFTKRGVGVAAVFHAMGYGRNVPDFATAKLELTREGSFRIYSGVSDMGQGNASTYLQIAGDILGQPAANIELIQPDTSKTLYSGSSAASRTTYTYGNALVLACEDLRGRLYNRAALLLFLTQTKDLRIKPGKVLHEPSGREIPLSRLAGMMRDEERTCIADYRAKTFEGEPVTGKEIPFGYPHVLFSYGAHLACVEVDLLTGRVRVPAYLAVTDAGRVLNPQIFEQQVQGAVAQGLGYALIEELITEDGKIMNADLRKYLIPRSMDVPDILCVAVDVGGEGSPLGMKGLGEIGSCGPLPAVANGVASALGVMVDRAPLSPQRILDAMERKAEESR